MDVRYINPFVLAIKSVFETMVHTTVTVGKPELLDGQKSVAEVSGVIGLSGDVVGSVVLGFPPEVAGKVATAFAGMPLEVGHPDFSDAIGELANMVAGNAKSRFEGMNVSISLPSVIVGHEHVVSQSRSFPRILIPCETPLGSVFVDVGIRQEKAAPRPVAALAGASK